MKQESKPHDKLINEFFEALELRDFDHTNIVLRQLRMHNGYFVWANYLEGVLEQERNNNWAKADEIFTQVLSDYPPKEIEALVYLSKGIAYQRLGRWPQCLEVSTKSAQLWEVLEQPLRKATAFRQIAIACFGGYLVGDFSIRELNEGRIKCQEALAILESPHITSTDMGLYQFDRELYQATTHEVLGTIENCAGNFDLACRHFEHYLGIAQKRQNQFHIALASSHLAKALHLSDLSQQHKILSLYETALHVFQQMQESLFEFHTLAAKGALYRKLGMPTEAIVCFKSSLSLLETVRTRASSESARRDFFSRIVNIHDNAILAEITAGNHLSAFQNAELARSRTFVDALTSIDYHATASSVLAILESSLRRRLLSDCLLLEFHCLGLLNRSGGQTSARQAAIDVLYPGTKLLLFAVTNESIQGINLDINPNDLIYSDLDKPTEENFLIPFIRRTLYDKLLSPIAHLLAGKRRLYIIPHGPLHYVPFHALIAPDGDTLLREGGPEIVYAPSATILFRELQKKSQPTPGTCLAVGYNGDKGMELHFAEEEAAYISHMASGTALVGPSSKKERLYQQAPHFQALHFSCHGEFDPESPLESLLHIGPGETLTGQEIMDNLRLNCDLVTLSACESGLSKVQRGDELYGLIRAFMYAGAPAIIATLWRVDERSTLIFAEKFYELIQQDVPYATALKEAQLYLKNLTRQEALAILTRHLANTATTDKASLLLQADHYLKSLSTRTSAQDELVLDDVLPGERDDDKIFADPKFWAPFVLIGDPQIQRRTDST